MIKIIQYTIDILIFIIYLIVNEIIHYKVSGTGN